VKAVGDSTLNYEENKAWMDLLQLSDGASASQLAAAQVAAGDAVMQALWRHVQVCYFHSKL
jgi:hypothetical protein